MALHTAPSQDTHRTALRIGTLILLLLLAVALVTSFGFFAKEAHAEGETTTTLTVSPAGDIYYPGPITFTATVTGSTNPGDKVYFAETNTKTGVTTTKSETLINGVAVWEINAGVGNYTVSAVHQAADGTTISSASPVPFEVKILSSTTTLSVPNYEYGASTTISGTVATSPTYTEILAGIITVKIYTDPNDPDNPLKTISTEAKDTWKTDPLPNLIPGIYYATAEFSGSGGNIESSVSDVVPFTVSKIATEASILTLPASVPYGAAIPGEVKVTAQGTLLNAVGEVGLSLTGPGGTEVISGTSLNSEGIAAFSFPQNSAQRTVGTYTISAEYVGDSQHADSSAQPRTIDVVAAATSVTLDDFTPDSLAYGQTTGATATATVRSTDSSLPVQEGTVVICQNGVPVPGTEVSLANGTLNQDYSVTVSGITIPSTSLRTGRLAITAHYVPAETNPNFQSSVSSSLPVTVSPIKTTTTVRAVSPLVWGTSINVIGTVTTSSGAASQGVLVLGLLDAGNTLVYGSPVVASSGTTSSGAAPQGTMVFRLLDANNTIVYTSPEVPVVNGTTGQVSLNPNWDQMPSGTLTLSGEFRLPSGEPWEGSVGVMLLGTVSKPAQNQMPGTGDSFDGLVLGVSLALLGGLALVLRRRLRAEH